MKKLLVIATVVLLPLALAAQTKHVKLTNDGAFASVQTSDSTSNFELEVSRGLSTGNNTSTNLFFVSSSFNANLTVFTIIEIVGPIPNSAFTGDNTKNLALNLDPSTLDPTVATVESCTIDFTAQNPSFVCGPLPAGTIQLSFQENDFQLNHLVQTQTSTVGPVTINSHQRSDSGSANVTGTIFGTSVSSSNGNVGVNHLSSIEFTRQ
ncbi:MAG TPA: hypothetical protein VHV32_02030 [Candidatus Angelobacter sp.]|jgi:hypothetical protein|nr:hypothetical protein [Candidatus Angelobacter sp.]